MLLRVEINKNKQYDQYLIFFFLKLFSVWKINLTYEVFF